MIFRGAVQLGMWPSGPVMVPTYLAYFGNLHLTKFFTMHRHPFKERLATFTAVLCPVAFPIVQIEPSDLIHCLGRQEPKRSSSIESMRRPLQSRQHMRTEPAAGSQCQHGSLECSRPGAKERWGSKAIANGKPLAGQPCLTPWP